MRIGPLLVASLGLGYGIYRTFGAKRREKRKPSRAVRTLILGAGFSKHFSGGAFPLAATLGRELLQEFDWLAQMGGANPDIEAVLTQVDLLPPDVRGKRKEELLRFISGRLGLSNVTASAIASGQGLCNSLILDYDTVITFNYDLLLEHLLWRSGRWTPNGGYGSSVKSWWPATSPHNPCGIRILKLHGSLNFVPPIDGSDAYLNVRIDPETFPGMHSNVNKSPFVAPLALPSYVKTFGETRTLLGTWHEAVEAISESNTLALVGYSLRADDSLARFLVSFFGSTADGRNRTLRIACLAGTTSEAHTVRDRMHALGRYGNDDATYEHFAANQYGDLVSWLKYP